MAFFNNRAQMAPAGFPAGPHAGFPVGTPAGFLAGRKLFGFGRTFDYNPPVPRGPAAQFSVAPGSGPMDGSGADGRGVADPWRLRGTFFPPVRSPGLGLDFFGPRKALRTPGGLGPYLDFNPLGAGLNWRPRVAPPPQAAQSSAGAPLLSGYRGAKSGPFKF